MFPLKITTSYLSFYCFGSKTVLFWNVKNFRESYVFHCLVIKVSVVFDSSFTLSHLFDFVKNFFQVFSNSFSMCCCRLFSPTTRLFYHSFSSLSRTFLFIFCFFIFHKKQKIKRRRRDLNPRAGYPTYTLSRGTSSASWVLLQTPNFQLLWNSIALYPKRIIDYT